MARSIRRFTNILQSPLAEIVGLCLILISVGWQVFLEDKLAENQLNERLSSIEQKLGIIWHYTGTYAPELAGEGRVRIQESYNDLTLSFNSAHNSLASLDDKVEVVVYVRMALFSIGSLLTVYARYREVMRMELTSRSVARGENT